MPDHPRPTTRARELRATATPAEKRLWLALNGRQRAGARFSRQMPIGPYFADFLCRARKLVVEVDDPSHDLRWRKDVARTAYLEREGYRVVRFTNADVRDRLEGVLHVIEEALVCNSPTPAANAATPPTSGRGDVKRNPIPFLNGRIKPSPLPPCGRGSREAAGWACRDATLHG